MADSPRTKSQVCPHEWTREGKLPFLNQPVRFAVGDPTGLSSNTWRVWAQPAGDIYVACRDIFQEIKVSLHMSGRWRLGFTTEAAKGRPDLFGTGQNRAAEVWDKPAEIKPGVIQAFRITFPSSHLRVRPEDRHGRKWKNVIYIEEGPPALTTSMVIYVTQRPGIHIEGLHSFVLGTWSLPEGNFAHLVAQAEPFDTTQVELAASAVIAELESAGGARAEDLTCWMWGTDQKTGARSLVLAIGRPGLLK